MCRALIEKGARVNDKTSFDTTPLHVAAAGGHTETVALLCEKGANKSAEHGCVGLLPTPRVCVLGPLKALLLVCCSATEG